MKASPPPEEMILPCLLSRPREETAKWTGKDRDRCLKPQEEETSRGWNVSSMRVLI